MTNPVRIALFLFALALVTRPSAAGAQGQKAIDTDFHVGGGLSIRQPLISDETDLVPELELGLIIAEVADLYLAVGLDIERESFKDEEIALLAEAKNDLQRRLDELKALYDRRGEQEPQKLPLPGAVDRALKAFAKANPELLDICPTTGW